MKKLLTSAALLGSVLAVSACASDGYYQDHTMSQAPYAEERTVGPEDRARTVRSAEPVFERRQVK